MTQAIAISGPISRAPSAIALASLCRRASEDESGSATCAQRQAGLRLAAIATPMPELVAQANLDVVDFGGGGAAGGRAEGWPGRRLGRCVGACNQGGAAEDAGDSISE